MIKIPMPNPLSRYSEAHAWKWCKEQFGPFELKVNVVSRWDYHNGIFYFRDEEDAVIFVLRWS